MVAVLQRRAATDPDVELVRFADGSALTVGDLEERSASLGRRLAGIVRRGEVVPTAFLPGPEQVVAMFALARAGAVELPVAVAAAAAATDAVAATAGSRLALMHDAFVAHNPSVADVLRRRCRVVDEQSATDLPRAELPPDPAPTEPAVVMTTSGTTGRPKGAVLPHFAAARHARRVASTMRYQPGDVLFNVFPWHHVNVRHAALLPALMTGARLVSHPSFSASRFWGTCRDEGVTAFNFMGAVVAILGRAEPSPLDRNHRLRRGYGGPAPAALCDVFEQRFGVELLEAYASTELGDVATNSSGDHRPGTAGRVVPEYEVRILGEDGSPLPAGEEGHLAVRPRAEGVRFLGYLGGEPATPPWHDWFVTGDRALLTADGYLRFRGRRDDVIRRRGENISAWEVEETVAMMPGVVDVAAVGVPSELTEEDVLVALTVAPGAEIDPMVVRTWCASRLPRHCVPRYVWIGPELPRNRSGKIVKRRLREETTLRAAWDGERR
jgi:crotonobetaine/carnitine-CoA ligase